jgi:Protein of unknown function (DUF3606)
MQRPIPYTSVMIDPANDLQVHHWAKDMQVEPYELRVAVALVGPRLSDLRRYFGKSAHIIFLDNRRRPTTVSPYGLPA